jgi:hypothetical protein
VVRDPLASTATSSNNSSSESLSCETPKRPSGSKQSLREKDNMKIQKEHVVAVRELAMAAKEKNVLKQQELEMKSLSYP